MRAWEQSFHPLRDEWVIVAAHRQNRPWIGETIAHAREPLPAYAPDCTFCPGNRRVSGKLNDSYEKTFVFDNDAPCVGEDAPEGAIQEICDPRAHRSPGLRPLAKITGGGSGGTIAVLARKGADFGPIVGQYERLSGHRPQVFSGSSPGSVRFGSIRLGPAAGS